MERDLDGYERNEDQLIISTHTLTWSVTLDKYKFVADWYNFNSHAHVERDFVGKTTKHALIISTHTLTWSVTRKSLIILSKKTISTHTLTWSVTGDGSGKPKGITISTHTLTWSVTLDVVYIWCLLNVMRTYCFI